MTSRVKLETAETNSEPKIVLKSSDMEQDKLEQTFELAKEVSGCQTGLAERLELLKGHFKVQIGKGHCGVY